MNPAEVVIGIPEHHGGAMVLKLLGKGVREPREAPGAIAKAQIAAFHDGCTDALGIRISAVNWDYLHGSNFGRGILALAFGSSAVNLNEHRVIGAIAEGAGMAVLYGAKPSEVI